MKTTSRSFIVAVLVLGPALVAPRFAEAQSAPTGSVTNVVTAPTNAVWDVDTGLTNVDFTVKNKDGSTVSVSYPISVQQMGSGRLTGGPADTTVELNVQGTNLTFTGSYKVTGSISSSRGRGHASLNTIVKGSAFIDGRNRMVTAKHAATVSFDNAAGTASGVEMNSASAAGKGTLTSRDDFSQSLDSVFPGNGSWTLVLNNLSTDLRNKITGSADITLNTGQKFQYTVRGVFKPKDGTSKLVLTGFDTLTKGSALQVGMSGNTVTNIKGKISGQMVNVVF